MLALTDNASLAIEGILSSEAIPDGAGVRIASASGDDGGSVEQLQVTIVGSPADTDQVIDAGCGRVFVDEEVAPLLDDKLLDADVVEDEIHFVLGSQGTPDGFPPGRNGSDPS